MRRYSTKMWKTFTDVFNCLPVAAVIDDKIFCCHGGMYEIMTIIMVHVFVFEISEGILRNQKFII